MFMLNGKPINIDAAQTIDGVQYPAGYFRPPARRAAFGIVEVQEQPRPDDRWYFVTPNGDGTWSSTPKSAGMMKPVILDEINAAYTQAVSEITAGYPSEEINSWPKQEAEARAYLADPDAPTPFIDGMLSERPIPTPEDAAPEWTPKGDLVTRIMAKVAAFEVAVGTLTGRRHALEDQIEAIPDEVDAVDTDLPNIKWPDQ